MCSKCPKRKNCRTVCPELSRKLKKFGFYESDTIRRKEIPFNPHLMDALMSMDAWKEGRKQRGNNGKNI